MHSSDKKIIKFFKDQIPENIKVHIKKMIVFGSRATGEAQPYSDLDVAVIVDRKTAPLEQGISDVAYQVMTAYDFKPIISVKVFQEIRFNQALKQGFSFYRRIMKEGVQV